MTVVQPLAYLANEDTHLFFAVMEPGNAYMKSDRALHLTLTDSGEVQLPIMEEEMTSHTDVCTKRFYFPVLGTYRLTLHRDDGARARIDLYVEDGILPYMMPGVGIVWNHGTLFPLLLAAEEPHTVYPLLDPAFSMQTVCVKGIGYGEDVALHRADGTTIEADWYPKLNRRWFWHSAEMAAEGEYIVCTIPPVSDDLRLTIWHSPLVALSRPTGMEVYRLGKVRLAAYETGENGTAVPIDARYSFYIGNERVAMYDILIGEMPEILLPEGVYTCVVSHGVCYRPETISLTVISGKTVEMTVTLETKMHLPQGYVLGELHTHSAFEDATVFPREILRAARANGRQFCFCTDKDVTALLAYGVHHCDRIDPTMPVSMQFLGLPGQEIMCHELHMNVLNVDQQIDNPEADNLGEIHPDIEARIEKWLAVYREMKKRRPCTIMHNHPSHNPQTMQNGMPYFRSWWVTDRFHAHPLVENFDYQGWFDRLNRGHTVFGAWTGDSHDCSLMYPGKEGVCVYVGDTLSSATLIDALENGRFFSLREPGAFLLLTVDGHGMGEHVQRTADTACTVSWDCGRMVEAVEVIGDGKVIAKVEDCGESGTQTVPIPAHIHWVIARIRLCDSMWEERTHSFTPLMLAGYDAFTNPVWIDDTSVMQ